MMKLSSLLAATLAMTTAALVPAGAADAQRHGYRGHGYGYDRASDRGRYDDRGGYGDRGYRRCKSGDTGLLVGAIAGGLLGRTIDTHGDRTMGTLLGAGAGGLAGRAIDRSDRPGYCRR